MARICCSNSTAAAGKPLNSRAVEGSYNFCVRHRIGHPILTAGVVDAVGTTEYSYKGLQQPTGMWTNGFQYDTARRLYNVTSPAGLFQYYFPPGLPSRSACRQDKDKSQENT